MHVAVADTHAVVWYLYADARLSQIARETIDRAGMEHNSILVSAITLIEMVYLIERGRIAAESLSRLMTLLSDPKSVFALSSIDAAIARTMTIIDRTKVPDMPDRIIVATARYYDLPLISRDHKIMLSSVETIW